MPLTVAVILLIVAQLSLPKRYAFVPMLIACMHLGDREILPELTPVRFMIIVGLFRAMTMKTLIIKPKNTLDKAFYVFSGIALLVSLAPRQDVPSPLMANLGLILNIHGSYLYGRSLLFGNDIIERFSKCMVIIMIPLAIGLAIEKNAGRNVYYPLGSASPTAGMRNGKIRAVGPFQHPILAGTCGAVGIPFGIFLIRRKKKLLGAIGIASSLCATFASASSGPIAAAMATGACAGIWIFRRRITQIQRTVLIAAIAAHIASSRGIWYLMASMDFVGGSTGYHRARLIDSAIVDFGNWWLCGTDYTRHWMFSGVSWSDRHTDITNYYLQFGVIGGVPLMTSFIAIILIAYKFYGKRIRQTSFENSSTNFGIWCVGSSLIAHTVSFLSVGYFDQSYANVFILIALGPALAAIDPSYDTTSDSPNKDT